VRQESRAHRSGRWTVRGPGPDAGSPRRAVHWMAIAAMEQYAWYIAVHGVETMDEIGMPEGIRVLLPYRVMRMEDPLPHTWEVTSDSISAWVAHRLNLPLLLLKSVDGLTRDGMLDTRVIEAFLCREVDPYFSPTCFPTGSR